MAAGPIFALEPAACHCCSLKQALTKRSAANCSLSFFASLSTSRHRSSVVFPAALPAPGAAPESEAMMPSPALDKKKRPGFSKSTSAGLEQGLLILVASEKQETVGDGGTSMGRSRVREQDTAVQTDQHPPPCISFLPIIRKQGGLSRTPLHFIARPRVASPPARAARRSLLRRTDARLGSRTGPERFRYEPGFRRSLLSLVMRGISSPSV